jgi:hypothetical protein
VVVALAWGPAKRCMATARMPRERRSASSFVSSSIRCKVRAACRRASSSTSFSRI